MRSQKEGIMSNQNNLSAIKLVVLGNWFLRIGLLVCLPTFFVSRLSADDDSSANARRPENDEALEAWLQNMVWHHGFTKAEITAATGLGAK